MLFPGVQLSKVTRWSLYFFRFFCRLFGVVHSAPTTIRITLVFTAQSHLSSRVIFWYLSTFTCSDPPLLLSLLGHCDIYQESHLVVLLHDYSIWWPGRLCSITRSVLEDFDFLRLYYWFSHLSVPLFYHTFQTPVDTCHVYSYTPDSFLYMYYVYHCIGPIACLCRIVTWWGEPGGIEAYPEDYYFLQCFDTAGCVIWPIKTRARYDLWCV